MRYERYEVLKISSIKISIIKIYYIDINVVKNTFRQKVKQFRLYFANVNKISEVMLKIFNK